jgi:hypothetical protein
VVSANQGVATDQTLECGTGLPFVGIGVVVSKKFHQRLKQLGVRQNLALGKR